MPVVLPSVTTPNISRHCQISPGEEITSSGEPPACTEKPGDTSAFRYTIYFRNVLICFRIQDAAFPLLTLFGKCLKPEAPRRWFQVIHWPHPPVAKRFGPISWINSETKQHSAKTESLVRVNWVVRANVALVWLLSWGGASVSCLPWPQTHARQRCEGRLERGDCLLGSPLSSCASGLESFSWVF